MENILNIVQVIVAISVVYVWVFRYHNVVREFMEFGLNDIIRNFVGASKISLATLLVVGVWFPSLVLIPSILMGALMICAQFFHFKVKNPLIKHIPSLILLILCSFIAFNSMA